MWAWGKDVLRALSGNVECWSSPCICSPWVITCVSGWELWPGLTSSSFLTFCWGKSPPVGGRPVPKPSVGGSRMNRLLRREGMEIFIIESITLSSHHICKQNIIVRSNNNNKVTYHANLPKNIQVMVIDEWWLIDEMMRLEIKKHERVSKKCFLFLQEPKKCKSMFVWPIKLRSKDLSKV